MVAATWTFEDILKKALTFEDAFTKTEAELVDIFSTPMDIIVASRLTEGTCTCSSCTCTCTCTCNCTCTCTFTCSCACILYLHLYLCLCLYLCLYLYLRLGTENEVRVQAGTSIGEARLFDDIDRVLFFLKPPTVRALPS